MSSLLRLARRLRSNDRGIALPVVIGMGLVMLVLISTAMTVATRGLTKTNTDEDWNGALAAAYAGVEEYQSRLANDATYQKYGNPAAPFTIKANSTSTVTLPTGANANPAFGVGPTGTWATVISGPDAVGPSVASFRYEIDNSDYQNKGVLHLRSTGRVGDVTRTVVADLKQEGFIDYLYFTNYEVQDPGYSGSTTATDANNKSVCERWSYSTVTRPAACGAPQFTPIDDFHGPVRSNDGMIICGSTFEGPVITSAPNAAFTKPSGCSNADFQVGGKPSFQPTIDMPPTNSELLKETRNDLTTTDVPRPGCLYTGPTMITLTNDGKMNVISPWTKKTNIAAATSGATNPAQCGIPGTATGQLGSPGGATIPILDLNLVFVQKVPADASDNPNANAVGFLPTGFTCPAASGSRPAGWMFKNTTVTPNTVVAQFPLSNEITPSGAASLVHYDCRQGDLYVKGTLKGQTTLSAENYIYITGDILYNDKQSDMLGLIGQGAIIVWNPRKSGDGPILTDTGREIDAALLSVGHTFQVQNFDKTPNRGTLTVFGAIAQKYRGTVVTFSGTTVSTGYAKDYQYDTRFRNTAPPKFLTPVSTTYGVTQYASTTAAYMPDGTVIPIP